MTGDILFLAHRIPFPPDRGDKIRSWHLLRHLGGIARVHLGCFADDDLDAARLPALRAELNGRLGEALVEVRRRSPRRLAGALLRGQPLSVASFGSRSMHDFVKRLLAEKRIETIFAFSGQMAQYVPDPVSARFVMDFVDADSAKFEDYGRSGNGPQAWLYRREGRLLLRHERTSAQRADVSLFVSEAEAALFRERAGHDVNVAAIGNGIDLEFYDPAANFPLLPPAVRGDGPLIVFTGQMDYRPNAEAVAAFAHDVMPRILDVHSGARFAIVGRRPARAVRRLHGRNGTLVTGAVEDVRSWLAAADVVAAPLGIARGIQNKLLEAMAMAKPAVASRAAFTGIEAEPGRDLLVADGPEEQARAVNALLADPGMARRLGMAARTCMAAYRWEARLAPLDGLVEAPGRRAAA